MIARLLRAAGVDPIQWKALTVTALRVDLRTVALTAGRARHGSPGTVRALMAGHFVFLVTGLFLSFAVAFTQDIVTGATLAIAATMLMVAMSVLVEHHALIVAPEDHAIIGRMPVTSRTFFAARLTNLVAWVTSQTAALALVPVGVIFVRSSFNPLATAAAVAAFWLAAVAAALAMVCLYAALVRVVPAARLKRALSYLQFGLSLVVYGAWALLPQVVSRSTLAGLRLGDSPWDHLNPASWFSAYVALAEGRWSWNAALASAASLVLLGGLAWFSLRFLSFEFSERLSAVAAEAQPSVPARRNWFSWVFRRGETRAVALLARAQFRQDLRFRLGILAIVPLTVFYLIMGLRDGALADPFLGASAGSQGGFLVYFAVLMFPSMLVSQVAQSDAYAAGWIFFATPVDRARLVIGAKQVAVVLFLTPYLLAFAVTIWWFFQSWTHVVLHVAILALVSHLFLQTAVFLTPAIPFSMPPRKGQRSGRLMGLMFVTGIFAGAVLPLLSRVIYPSMPRTVGCVGVLLLLTAILERALYHRLKHKTADLAYAG